MKAIDFIQPGESALVIFNKGKHFLINADKTGHSGYWVLNPDRRIDKVIIYVRNQQVKVNQVYVAEPGGVERRSDDGRYLIHLAGIKHVGTTDNSWPIFCEGGQNPVRYLARQR